jgi:pimeloyl-ACP methyl ester carboxylesterase
LLASDVLAVMDHLQLQKAAFVGWSDGACTALVLARNAALRSAGVFFFACNMLRWPICRARRPPAGRRQRCCSS